MPQSRLMRPRGRVRDLAKQDEISINQLIATALEEKMSALMTSDYLGERDSEVG